MVSLAGDVFLKAEEFVALLKEWLFEIRTRCNETKDPEECCRTVEQLNKKIEKFEKIMRVRKCWS